jgi:hypothetical protein
MSYREMLLKMRERGLDPRQRHTFDLYVCLPTKKASHAVNKLGCRFRFTVEVIPGAKRGTWFCIARKTSPPPRRLLPGYWREHLSGIAAAGELFDIFARKEGGYLHGWEVDIQKP